MHIGVTERGDAGRDMIWLKALELGAVDGVVAITKAPQLLLDIDLPYAVVVHCTITGHGNTELEPGVAAASVTLNAYTELVTRYGGERIVLRIDPIFACNDVWLARAVAVNKRAKGRVRISFFDFYSHVRERFSAMGIQYAQDFHAPLALRKTVWDSLGNPEVCAEPGLECSGCVSPRDVAAMGLPTIDPGVAGRQRPLCACATAKTELLKGRKPCTHGCLYCYWKGEP
jgi:hypothetical protein